MPGIHRFFYLIGASNNKRLTILSGIPYAQTAYKIQTQVAFIKKSEISLSALITVVVILKGRQNKKSSVILAPYV